MYMHVYIHIAAARVASHTRRENTDLRSKGFGSAGFTSFDKFAIGLLEDYVYSPYGRWTISILRV